MIRFIVTLAQRRFQGGGDAHLATPWAFKKITEEI